MNISQKIFLKIVLINFSCLITGLSFNLYSSIYYPQQEFISKYIELDNKNLSFSIESKDSSTCSFNWKGYAEGDYGKKLKNFQITAFVEDNILFREKSNSRGFCSVFLPMNKAIRIVIEKEGYVAKILSINTEIPVNVKNIKYELKYTSVFFKKENDVDVSILDKPIAEIKYDLKKDKFIYSKDEVAKVNKMISKRYKDYYNKIRSTKSN